MSLTNTHSNVSKNSWLVARRLGLVEYGKADAMQRDLQLKRQQEQVPDTILLLEHPNVITLGKRGTMQDILVESKILTRKEVSVVQTDRGGQNTIHAPGQLVGYLIINLYKQSRALRQFICDVEQSLIDTLLCFDVEAYRHKEHVGVWTDSGKIAAIGISVNHGVTRHGFALNINTAMDVFNLIVPCGIRNAHVTSMQTLLGKTVDRSAVEDTFIELFANKKEYGAVKWVENLV